MGQREERRGKRVASRGGHLGSGGLVVHLGEPGPDVGVGCLCNLGRGWKRANGSGSNVVGNQAMQEKNE